MTRDDLKKTLKPLIKQCIREVLLEETGVLSRVVSEVASGMTSGEKILSSSQPAAQKVDEQRVEREDEARRQELLRQKQEMLSLIGKEAYNGVDLFEGTAPLASGGTPSPAPTANGPMRNIDPNDPGIDISSIPGLNLDVARKLMG